MRERIKSPTESQPFAVEQKDQKAISPQRAHIEELKNAYFGKDGHPSGPAITLTNKLRDLGDLFGKNQFILEFLQNAEDAAVGDKRVTIEFIIKGGYLIIGHTNTRPFDWNDVQTICSYDQKSSTKSLDRSKIGYRGIGFKSVFTLFDNISIFSGGYQFRFAQADWKGQPLPWQLIPLWTEKSEFKNVIEPRFDTFNTFYLINLNDQDKIRNRLRDLLSNPERILFLRKTNSVVISDGLTRTSIKIEVDGNRRNILLDRQSTLTPVAAESWELSKRYLQSNVIEVAIPQEVQTQLAQLKDSEYSPKSKTSTEIFISFAVPLDREDRIIPVSASSNFLYSYLPTEVRSSLPFLVNAPFLLNSNGNKLFNNVLNQFLFEAIGRCQFVWFQLLAKTEGYRFQILKLLDHALFLPESFRLSYQLGLGKGAKDVKFLPSHLNPKDLLTAREAIVDKIGFWKQFPELDDYSQAFVNTELEGAVEHPIFIRHFGVRALIDNLESYAKQTQLIHVHVRLIEFLFQLIEKIPFPGRDGYQSDLKSTTFILTDSGYANPEGAYLVKTPAEIPKKLPEGYIFNFLHPKLFAGLSPKCQAWLVESLGMRNFSQKDFMNRYYPREGEVKAAVRQKMASIEQYVFSELQKHYKTKYQCELKDTDNGFELKATRVRPDGVSEPINLEVIWYNKNGESGKAADFKIIKNGEVRYGVVKDTRSGSDKLSISGSEWTLMMQKTSQLRLFRVVDDGQSFPKIEKIKPTELKPTTVSFSL